MSELRPPLRAYLPLPVDEAALARMRNGIDHRRRRRHQRRIALRAALVAGFAAAALAAGLFATRSGEGPGPLRLRDGRLPRLFESPSGGPELARSALDDGSEVLVRAGSRVRVVANDGRRFSLRMEQGTSRLRVTPGGPRTWVVRCDPVRVEVLGTRLEVSCTASVARIRVTESRVRVTGGSLPPAGVIVSAGQQIEVRRTAAVVDPGPAPAPAPPAPVPPAPTLDRSLDPPAPTPVPEAERRARAVRPAPPDPVATLMADADEERRAGRHAEAAALLERLVREHPGRREAPVAAFTRGRLLADRLGRPADAAAAFDKALALGLPGTLAEDARVRVVESWVRAGQQARAAAALRELRAHHPQSRRIEDAERWIDAIGTR